ncbi:MAG TPA: flagellar export chaperone FliS [Solirubrobacteraceae bacterium]|jgi:flagellar protein FliS|nr:flagellar export chaperone FliS [Solirubrobacteraceae bacterium]
MSNLATSPQAYRQGAVLAASREQLVVMLYDGARRFLRQSAVAMRAGEIERAHNTLRRAEMIIAHLDATLDFDQGEVAERLHSIYAFCLVHLNRARIAQDADMVEEVSGLLGELRDAWSQIATEAATA